MKKYFWIIIVVLLIAALVGGFFLWRYYKNRNLASQQTPSTAESTTGSTSGASSNLAPSMALAPTLVYPIGSFASRATTNLFGTYYPTGGSSDPDRLVCPNATYYPGYHNAVDLETTSGESIQDIPVFAIAAGTVRQVSAVSGYGGLIVVQYNLGGADYTAYYGHINLSTAKVKAGQSVKVGETLADLGPACSQANGDVRKHLHFGLHKGTTVDVRGYVPDKTALESWINPTELLKSLGAE